MDLRRVSPGGWAAALFAAVLVASLFTTWYEPGVSGWEAFAVADIVFVLGATAAFVTCLAAASPRTHASSIAIASVAVFVALVGAVVAVFRLVSPPGDDALERALGSWVGPLAAIAVLAALARGLRDEGPARRSPEAERHAADEALKRAELLQLPPDPPVAAGER